jgi:Ca2+-binding RTX toxin-like protein
LKARTRITGSSKAAALAAAATALALSVGVAQGAPGSDATIHSISLTVPILTARSPALNCPNGMRETGGGVTATTDARGYEIQLNGPIGNVTGDVPTGWSVYIGNFFSNSDRVFKVSAICSATADTTLAVASFIVPATSQASRSVDCPAGTRVTGGGVTSGGPTADDKEAYDVQVSGPTANDGTTANTNDGDVARGFASYELNASSTDQGFKSFALCASDPSAPGQNPNGAPGGGGGGGGGTNGQAPKCAGHRATIVGTSGRDRIVGTRRADVIVALGGSDRISGGGGDDIICGGAGNDRISGGSGNDKLYGQDGKDTVSGGSGDDRASGGAGNDKVSGGSGDDNLAGGSGNDKLSGGSGTDKDSGGGGKDSCSGPDKKSSC